MTDIQHAAEIHWRALNNEPVSQQELEFCLRFVLGNYKGSLIRRISSNTLHNVIGTLFYQQEKAKVLSQQWQDIFRQPATISAQEASRFLFEVYSSLEETDALFDNEEIVPGATRQKRHTVSDFVIKRPHTKLGWTLQLTTQGKGLYNCVRSNLITKPGDLLLLSPNALYDYRRAQDCEMWEHLWIYFKPEPSWFDLLQWPEVGPNIYHISSQGREYNKLKQLLFETITAHEEQEILTTMLIKNLLEHILIRCRQLAPQGSMEATNQRFNRAKAHIAEHFNQTLSIETVANKAGLSAKQLSMLFKQHTGTTFKRWRDELRMGRACQLLIQTQQPINQIANIVGYNDSLYFSRCFRKYLNSSPRDYRLQHRKIDCDLTLT